MDEAAELHANESTQGKKRKSNPQAWKRNVSKQARLHGKEHVDYKGKLVAAKTTGKDCR